MHKEALSKYLFEQTLVDFHELCKDLSLNVEECSLFLHAVAVDMRNNILDGQYGGVDYDTRLVVTKLILIFLLAIKGSFVKE